MDTINIISSCVSGLVSGLLFHHTDVMYYNSIKNPKFGPKDFFKIKCEINDKKVSVYQKAFTFNVITTIIKVCSIFPIQEFVKHKLDPTSDKENNLTFQTVSGMLTGSLAALVATPINTVKVPMMTKETTMIGTYRQIMSTRGLKGFYRGITPTIGRDVAGYGTYFFLFHAMNTHLHNNASSSLVASVIALCVAYPFDVVRTMRQDSTNNINLKDCFKKAINTSNSNRTSFIIFMTRMILGIPVGHCTYLWTKSFLVDKK